jgi:hypothetical protein
VDAAGDATVDVVVDATVDAAGDATVDADVDRGLAPFTGSSVSTVSSLERQTYTREYSMSISV